MGFAVRLAWAICLAWLLTACAPFPSAEVVHRTSFSTPLTVLTAMPVGISSVSPTHHLSQNSDGSISVQSDRLPISLLRGLDPAQVNPTVLPFLFPSCDAALPR